MNKFTSALKKKWGPLPAWVWLFGGGLLYYFYRKYSSTGSVSGTGTGSVGPAPTTPQPQTVLQPGESVYDPNTGSLTTAPGGGGANGSLDPNGIANAIAAGIIAAFGSDLPSTGNSGAASPQDPGSAQAGVPAATTANGGPKGKPKLTARGALYAPFGHSKPAARAGYTIRGLGRGFWEYVPKQVAKSKGQHNAQAKTSKPIKPSNKTRARSTATARHHTGGRTASRQPQPTTVTRHSITINRARPTVQQPSRARQRPRQPAVRQVVTQRRPASLPRQSPTRQEGGVAPRPSAPPPRTHRAPVPPPPRRTAPPRRRGR